MTAAAKATEDVLDEMNTLDAKRIVEAALICAGRPLSLRELGALFVDEVGADTLRGLIAELAADCGDRGIELVAVASGWRYQSRAALASYLGRLHPERPPRYSRALLETLAIVAYRQPVTRGDIEDIRGVAVASSIVKQLEDRGWIEAIGYRDTVGRPALLATTAQFLDDLGLAGLSDLPTLEGAGDAPLGFDAVLAGDATQSMLAFANGADESSPAPPSADPDPATDPATDTASLETPA